MKFSILTSAYRTTFWDQVEDSVLSQYFRDWEWIVVDDTDGTESFWNVHDDRVITLANENRPRGCLPAGLRTADEVDRTRPVDNLNLAAKHAKGDYLLFLDDDNFLYPFCLWALANVLNSCNKSPKWGYFKQHLLISDGDKTFFGGQYPDWPNHYNQALLDMGNFIDLGALFVLRSHYLEIGGLSRDAGLPDYALIKLLAESSPPLEIDQPLAIYRFWVGGNVSKAKYESIVDSVRTGTFPVHKPIQVYR